MKTLHAILEEINQAKFSIYIYVLHKLDGTPFYVGKGGYKRVSHHEKEARSDKKYKGQNTFKLNTIRKIWREGGEVLYSIDTWHSDPQAANDREVEVIAHFGRRILGEGSLTNITAGGEGCLDMPQETRDKLSASLRQHYIDNPWTEEQKQQISDTLKQYCDDHPEFIELLQEAKDRWERDNPEKYAEVRARIVERMQEDSVREQISETLKEFYSDPKNIKANSDRIKRYFAENPEAREIARENAIVNNACANLLQWMGDNPEESQRVKSKNGKMVAEYTANNPEVIEKRNESLRTESHRAHMSKKTAEWIQNNPEEHIKRRDKANKSARKTFDEKAAVRNQCLRIIHDELVKLGEIEPVSSTTITSKVLYSWRQKGLIQKYFPAIPKSRKLSDWIEFENTI